jgi:hypothetical protein
MSNRYKGGVISATPPTLVAGAGASGTWTLEQQMQATAAGLWPVNGPFYIEEVFSTWLYTGNDTSQTITNGIDLAGKGGLVWCKSRTSTNANWLDHTLTDTVRGPRNVLISNSTASSYTNGAVSAFNSNGFSLNVTTGFWENETGKTYASWTFREQPKFFDVVTYTGTGSARTVAHNLGSEPGCMIVKRTDSTGDWWVYHRDMAASERLRLNTTAAKDTALATWDNTRPTSTVFSVGATTVTNASGGTYVAYLFAHNAGGFGLTGTDNVISCGGVTSDGSGNATVNLGYEPQWLLIKRTDTTGNWHLMDTMRGLGTASGFVDGALLRPNLSDVEASPAGGFYINSTGFQIGNGMPPNASWIYIAIRRGPMKVPTTGTSVFAPQAWTGDSTANRNLNPGFVDDMFFYANRTLVQERFTFDRLRGTGRWLSTASSGAEVNQGAWVNFTSFQNGINTGPNGGLGDINTTGVTNIGYHFRRAPSFFDEVCYTGTGVARTVAHNLAAVPELIITKRRDLGGNWNTYSASLGNTGILFLEDTSGNLGPDSSNWNNTSPTASVFTVGTGAPNLSGGTYVAYLFATCPGVSKVGSYTGTGATQVINCGFTAGARFVLIKATSTTGNWLVYDTARGMIPSNDPYLTLNTTAAEVTGTDWVDTAATGFELSNAGGNLANSSGVSYIFLAIA